MSVIREPRTCDIDGCERRHHGNGLCSMHRQRLRKFGSVDPPAPDRYEQPCIHGGIHEHGQRVMYVWDRCRCQPCVDASLDYGRRRRAGLVPRMVPRFCEVDGCGRKHRARGMCQVHERRLRQTGQFDLREKPRPQPLDRFWEKVDTSGGPTECWPWLASKNRAGYGQFTHSRLTRSRTSYAHRFSWEITNATPIPPGLQLDHLCRVRHCVNPAHLEPVTPAENNRRMPGGARMTAPIIPWPYAKQKPCEFCQRTKTACALNPCAKSGGTA